MPDSVSPGWYPNPSGEPNSVRYWDGQTWTEERQLDAPAAQAASTDTSASAPPKRNRKAMWIAAGALVVVAVIVGFTVFGNNTEDEAIDRCTSAVADRMSHRARPNSVT